jgi:hypothetical protein
MTTPFDPDKFFYQVIGAGNDWSDKNAAADLLEESKKSILAELMNGHASTASAQSARESLALADPVYRLHITSMVTARKEANRARVKYDAMKMLAELRRSQESTRRAEMSLR